MKKSPKKIIKNTAKVGAVLWGLVLWWYHLSEEIGYVQHDIQKELKDTLWKTEILQDQETNDIIKLMSWKISQHEFDSLLFRHGYTNDTIQINKLVQPDEAMYKTILEMQTKYANPKISFSWFFKNLETWENEPSRARFNPITNTIHSHQLDSVLIKFDDVKAKEKLSLDYVSGLNCFLSDTWQKYLLNNRIAELAHAKQLKEKWFLKFWINSSIDYIRSGFDYDKTYFMPWTIEYQAHKEYEQKLIQEFIATYEKYSDKKSFDYLRELAKFNSWFFEKYKNEYITYTSLHKLWKMWDPRAYYRLAKLYFDLYQQYFWSETWLNETSSETIFGKSYTSKTLFDEIIWYYKKSYDMGDVQAWIDLVSLYYYSAYEWKEYNALYIDIWESLIKNHLHDMDKQVIGNLCQRLWSFYYAAKNRDKWNIYFAMSDEYWWAYPYFY